MLNFECDYMKGACKDVLQRLIDTNMEETPGYGADRYCESAARKIREACCCPDAGVYFLTGGTQTNATVMYAVLRHCQGVISPVTGHINHHESGAVEATGHKVIALPGHEGKLDADEIRQYLKSYWADENYAHMVEPGMVYITHPTELGTLYSLEELKRISGVCREYSIPLYMDGARLAYALASGRTDISLQDIASLCDIFYIGGTKCGALFGEALVIPDQKLTGNLFSIIKQRGAMLAKGRLLGLQFDTLFTDGLYTKLAENAIKTADMLVKGLEDKGYVFHVKPQTNQIFVIADNSTVERLRKDIYFSVWEHLSGDKSVIRLVTDWSTSSSDIESLVRFF